MIDFVQEYLMKIKYTPEQEMSFIASFFDLLVIDQSLKQLKDLNKYAIHIGKSKAPDIVIQMAETLEWATSNRIRKKELENEE